MPHGRAYAFSALAAFAAWALPAGAQSVISTHSGLIHYFEGAVYLGDQALEPHLGRFPSVPQGAELRTVEGRAELLLTPGVFLRMGERSSIRMVANDLADTQVELQAGSVIVDGGEPNLNTSVTLIYKDWTVHLLGKGAYRIDSDPPRLSVRQGRAEVTSATSVEPVPVEQGMSLPFASVLVPEKSKEPFKDTLGEWSTGRNQSISADNTITAQLDEDPAAQPSGVDNFTYYPFLGLSSLGAGAVGPYSSYYPSQPGFNSIYLPGYTYQPIILGIMGGTRGMGPAGYRYPGYLPAPRFGVSPGPGVMVPGPRAPIVRPAGPAYPGSVRPGSLRPGAAQPGAIHPGSAQPGSVHPGSVHPGTVHAPSSIGVHGGAHR